MNQPIKYNSNSVNSPQKNRELLAVVDNDWYYQMSTTSTELLSKHTPRFDTNQVEHYLQLLSNGQISDEAFAKTLNDFYVYSPQKYHCWPKQRIWETYASRIFHQSSQNEQKIDVFWSKNRNEGIGGWLNWRSYGQGGKTTTIDMDLLKYVRGTNFEIKVVASAWSGNDGYSAISDEYISYYPNYADIDLFYACNNWLLAQDEWICAEHPLLLSLRYLLEEESNKKSEIGCRKYRVHHDLSVSADKLKSDFGDCFFVLGDKSMVVTHLPRYFKINAGVKQENIYGDAGKLFVRSGGPQKDFPTTGEVKPDRKNLKLREGEPDSALFFGEGVYNGYIFGEGDNNFVYPRNELTNIYIMAAPKNVGWKPPDLWPKKKIYKYADICDSLQEREDPFYGKLCEGECHKFKLMDDNVMDEHNKHYEKRRAEWLKDKNNDQLLYQTYETFDNRYLCYKDPGNDRYIWYGNRELYYTKEQIMHIFQMALTTFKLVKKSHGLSPKFYKKKIELDIGSWGGGEFHNNVGLVAILQLIAAKTAGIELVVYHDPFDQIITQQSLNEQIRLFIKYGYHLAKPSQNIAKMTPQFFEQIIDIIVEQKMYAIKRPIGYNPTETYQERRADDAKKGWLEWAWDSAPSWNSFFPIAGV